jgi:hypothetical protein
MLGQEPDLQFIGANHVADQQIIGAVVVVVVGLLCELVSLLKNLLIALPAAGKSERELLRDREADAGLRWFPRRRPPSPS